MTPALFNLNVDEAFDLFIGNAIDRAEDFYLIDGETAFRRRNGRIEIFDADCADLGGRS